LLEVLSLIKTGQIGPPEWPYESRRTGEKSAKSKRNLVVSGDVKDSPARLAGDKTMIFDLILHLGGDVVLTSGAGLFNHRCKAVLEGVGEQESHGIRIQNKSNAIASDQIKSKTNQRGRDD
jgi:hypothetical protein